MGVGPHPVVLRIPPDVHSDRPQTAAEIDGTVVQEGRYSSPFGRR